jgi:hypothetical protein
MFASARARAGSRYPKSFDEPCQKKTWRRLGLTAGLTQFGVNLLELGPGTWSSQRIGTLTKTSSSMSPSRSSRTAQQARHQTLLFEGRNDAQLLVSISSCRCWARFAIAEAIQRRDLSFETAWTLADICLDSSTQ